MELDLKDKRVLITGASKGIGLATAQAFAAEGSRVLICARNEVDLKRASGNIREVTGRTVETVVADVTRVSDLDDVARTVQDRFGGLDVLVNNAGNGIYKPFLEVTEGDLIDGMAINFIAPFLLTQKLAPSMIEQGGGVVVNVAGGSGMRTTPAPFYSSCTGPAKAAEIRLSSALASELGPHNVRVNCIVPGLVNTGRLGRWQRELGTPNDSLKNANEVDIRKEWGRSIARPNNEWGSPAEVADLILFVASGRSAYVNGATIVIDGGEDKS